MQTVMSRFKWHIGYLLVSRISELAESYNKQLAVTVLI